MPEKSSSVISYAAGASLAAVALIYVFGPNFTIDHDSAPSKRKTIVGLRNQANDCFINSVLQALAGLGELRVYLIRETHRRRIEDPRVYATLVQPEPTTCTASPGGGEGIAQWKLQGLQDGLVTSGLKDMLDALNERPIAKKAISPFPFVRVLETAFKQRISRQQQDAQEFLQIVAERLKDEYHAGQRARAHARKLGFIAALDRSTGSLENLNLNNNSGSNSNSNSPKINNHNNEFRNIDSNIHHKPLSTDESVDSLPDAAIAIDDDDDDAIRSAALDGSFAHIPAPIPIPSAHDVSKSMVEVQLLAEASEDGFPLEGKYESHIKCQSCGYTTKPREESFCSLTLAVPQVASTTLNACFDGIFKTEYIDDFRCEMCRLLQAKTRLEEELETSSSSQKTASSQEASSTRAALLDDIEKLRWAIQHDPERAPDGVDLGDIRHAPRRRIAKTTRMVTFPRILAVHLSRSIYDVGKITQKNSAMVAFPEQLPLGGLMQQRRYKLLGLVTHRGGHNSGHYEAFRRQNTPSPYANRDTFMPSEVYSKTSTPASTPEILAHRSASPAISTPDLLSASSGSVSGSGSGSASDSNSNSNSSSPSLASSSSLPRPSRLRRKGTADNKDSDASSLRSVANSTKSALSRLAGGARDRSKEKDKDKDKKSKSGNASPPLAPAVAKHLRKKKPASDKWWRVSDEKVKEAKTSDVLSMQREVYLLFYELEREE